MSANPADIIANLIRIHARTVGAGALGEMILSELSAAGIRVLAPGQIDPETRERCAAIAGDAQEMREQLYQENFASINAHKAVQAEEIATAIRAMEDAG